MKPDAYKGIAPGNSTRGELQLSLHYWAGVPHHRCEPIAKSCGSLRLAAARTGATTGSQYLVEHRLLEPEWLTMTDPEVIVE